ncbi:MAG: hypothetical protein VR67_00530 [Peptococcaceae bacterium BRH_c8a]|nr:MAG: hypothetical protein VR67_00530 [Peptococcaceae bacterium BRH_c8a]
MLVMAWFLMILASLAFWYEPLRIVLWTFKAVFIYLATVLQGGSGTFFIIGHTYSFYETIYVLGLVAIPILVLIIELSIKIAKARH